MDYFGSSWCRNISAVVGAEIFRGIPLSVRNNIRTQYTSKYNISAADIILKTNQYAPKYFGPNDRRNISFLCVLIAYITPKAEQYSPQYFGTNGCQTIIFSCVLSAHIIANTKRYSLESFGTNSCWNIPFSCVLTACIMPKANQYSPKYFGTNCCQKISFSHGFSAYGPRATSNIPHSISVPIATKILHCHVY